MDRFSEAIENSKVDVVPRIVVGGQKEGGQGSGILDTLLTMLLSDKLEGLGTSQLKRSPETEALRESIKNSVKNNTPAKGSTVAS